MKIRKALSWMSGQDCKVFHLVGRRTHFGLRPGIENVDKSAEELLVFNYRGLWVLIKQQRICSEGMNVSRGPVPFAVPVEEESTFASAICIHLKVGELAQKLIWHGAAVGGEIQGCCVSLHLEPLSSSSPLTQINKNSIQHINAHSRISHSSR